MRLTAARITNSYRMAMGTVAIDNTRTCFSVSGITTTMTNHSTTSSC